MSVVNQVAPKILELCLEWGKGALLDYYRHRVTKPASSRPQTQREPPPPGEACPYCTTAKNLAIAYRYLHRGHEGGMFTPIYVELARSAIHEAADTLQRIPPQVERGTLQLMRQVTEFEVLLSRPLQPKEMRPIADRIWQATDLAFDLAEQYQSRLRDMDEALQHMDAQVVEGEARIASEEA